MDVGIDTGLHLGSTVGGIGSGLSIPQAMDYHYSDGPRV